MNTPSGRARLDRPTLRWPVAALWTGTALGTAAATSGHCGRYG
ncbi:hypothetical protein [Streptomyces sp. NPDC051109]